MSDPKFSREAMYLGFGQFDNVATFFLKPDSDAYNKYGNYLTGTIRYSKKDREQIETNIENCRETYEKVRINYLLNDKDEKTKLELRKIGVDYNDITQINFLPANRENKFKKKQKRVIPNIIEIPFDAEGVKYSNLFFGLINRRLARDKKLIDEEIFELIGILMAQNDRKISPNLLNKFNLDPQALRYNDRVWYHYFKALVGERELTKEESSIYSGLRNKIYLDRIGLITKELEENGNGIDPEKISQEALGLIFEKVDTFKPERLLQTDFPIYWDFKSFVHIYLRHVEELQIAMDFQNKSAFQYEPKDIRQLIISVLEITKDAIKKHFTNSPDKKFTRHGSLAVYFNGDYYCFDISPKGRLITFYKQG